MIIAPSLLAADFLDLKNEIKKLNDTDCELIHLDVMDGVFVNDITFGYPLIKSIKEKTTKKLDVHLMVKNPFDLIVRLCELGVNYITIHVEVIKDEEFIKLLKVCEEKGVILGLALNPDSLVKDYKKYLKQVKYILLMSVVPGKGGQKFIEEVLDKEKEIRNLENGQDIIINIDGGINDKTIDLIRKTTINIVVSGSYLFNGNIQENISKLR